MNNNITKGKWGVHVLAGTDGLYCRIKDEQMRIIADCYSFSESIPNKEAEANAQAIASLPDIIRENEELKARCETYKKDYDSMVKEVVRLSGENSKMKQIIDDRIKELKTKQ